MPLTYSSRSIPYTAAPIQLILSDLALWLRITFVLPPAGIPSIIFPAGPFNSGHLDELYPTVRNYWALFIHLVLTLTQLFFFVTVIPAAFGLAPPWVTGYTPIWVAYVFLFGFVTRWFTRLVLNGGGRRDYVGLAGVTEEEKNKFAKEKWIFVNGVAAGSHWMQSNLDRLSLTFRREITGIHNETRGILFDLVECVLERTIGWATPSARTVYARILDIVSDDAYERIVLILHSQGAIEGGLALDWLFATVPASSLSRVEVYTFGSATNHFNNPCLSAVTEQSQFRPVDPGSDARILKHIEHYANIDDYVSQFGILNFRMRDPRKTRFLDLTAEEEAQNMYAGRLFIRKAYGHQFANNYLDKFFTFNADRTRVLDENPFMDSEIDETLLLTSEIVAVKPAPAVANPDQIDPPLAPFRRAKDVSRLWEYRNGGVPVDDDDSN